MSTTSYTRIENTVVSGSTLLSGLSDEEIRTFNFHGSLASADVITLVGSNHSLTVNELAQAVVKQQLVNGSGLSASKSLLLGSDMPIVAANYVQLFGLTASTSHRVIMNFQVSGANDHKDYTVSLANADGTNSNFVKIQLNNSAAAATKVLFPASTAAGLRSSVEVFATNVSPGSEVVWFNIANNNLL